VSPWNELELRWKVMLVCMLVAGVVASLPYLLAYVLLPVGIGIGLGFLFRWGCDVGYYRRWYGNVSLFLPITAGLTFLLLSALAPQPQVQSATSKFFKIQMETPDWWRTTFNSFYHFWYGHMPVVNWFIDRASLTNYRFLHFYWTVIGGVCGVAPFMFWVLHAIDLVRIEDRATEAAQRRREERDSRLDTLATKLAAQREHLLAAIEARDAEIERLKLREKYLTSGKPRIAIEALDKPDLGYL